MLIAILEFLVITAIAAAFARRALARWMPEFDSMGERLIFESAIGLGMLALVIFGLGVVKLFYLPAFLAALLGMAAIGWRELSEVISEAIQGIRGIRKAAWRAETAAAGILGIIGILTLIRALAPPIADDWDSLAYHLAVPKLFLRHHGIYYINFTSHSNFPFNWEMLYSLGLAFGSVSLAKLFHFGAGVLLVTAVYSFGKRHFNPGVGVLAALVIGGAPVVAWEATTAYIDLAAALYTLLVVYALMNYSTSGDRRWAIIAGICAGFAAGAKMTALLMIPVAIVWILWSQAGLGKKDTARQEPRPPDSAIRNPKSEIGAAVIAAALAIIIAAPWYIKSFIYTGNPVYPFFYGIFGGRNWSSETAMLYRADQLAFGMGHGWAAFLMLPWNLTFRFARFVDFGARLPSNLLELPGLVGNSLVYLASIGPMFLAALPAIATTSLKQGRHRPILVVSLVMIAAWFFTMQNARYFIPILALLAIAIAQSADLARVRKIIFGIGLATAAFTALLLILFIQPSLQVALGLEKPSDYLGKFDIYRASEFINQNLPSDAKIALFGETRGFYLDRDYLWADAGHNALIPYRSFGDDPKLLIHWLKLKGFEYMLVNHANPGRPIVVNLAIDDGLQEIYTDPTGSVSVYRLPD